MSSFVKKESNPVISNSQTFSTWNCYKLPKSHNRTNSGNKQRNNQTQPRGSWKKDEVSVQHEHSAIMTRKRNTHKCEHFQEHFQNVNIDPVPRSYRQQETIDNCRTHYSPMHSNMGENQIEERFKEIEQLFSQQNENLKQQKLYLLQVIEKMKKKQKQYKNQIKSYKQANDELYFQNNILKKKYEQAREFISTGIGKIEEAVNNSVNNSISSTQNIPSRNSLTLPPQPPQPPKNVANPHIDTTTSMNVSDAIEQLSDKFDALMFEYQKTRSPELRKQCMQIAKEIKRLKKSNGVSVISNQTH